jgi:uncharacterized protein YhaN
MKINKIEIYGFGKWNNVIFDLKQDLQVFYGLNEAGKSTLRQFIYSILFGFAAGRGSNKYLQYIPKKAKGSAGYGGVLIVEHHGQSYGIERIKGKNGGKVTITQLDNGTEMSFDFLTEMLGPIDQNTYERLLGFNQSDLDDFNDLGNRDDLRRHILRMGAVGSDEWIKLENDLKKESNKMYTTSSRTRELDKKIKAYDEAVKQLQADKAKLPDYQSTKALEEQINQQLKQVRSELADLNTKMSETANLINAWSTYAEILDLKQKLKDVPVEYLKLDLNQIEVLANKIRENQNEIRNLQSQLEKLQSEESTAIDVDKLDELQSKLPEARLNYGQLEDLNRRIERLNTQLEEIKAQYEVSINDVDPMTDDQFTELKDLLLKQKRKNADINQLKTQMLETTANRRPAPTSNSTIVLGIVAVLVVIDLLIPLNWIFKFIILAVILGGGYVTTRTKEEVPDASEESLNDVLLRTENEVEQIYVAIRKLGNETGFDKFPIEDWVALQPNLLNYQHVVNEIAELKTHLKQIEEQIDVFWKFSDGILPTDEHHQATIKPLAEQVNAMTARYRKQQEMVQHRELINRNLEERQVELDESQKRFKQFNIPEINMDFDDWLKQIRIKQHLNLSLKTLQESNQTQYFEKLQQYDDVATLRQIQKDQEQKVTELKQNEQNLLDQRSDQLGELTGLKNSVDILAEQQLLSEQETEIKDMVAEWLTLQLGAEWVDQTLGVATKGRLPVIIDKANEYFVQITNRRYQKIEFDKDDMISVTDEKGNTFEIGELSKGTIEQLYISIRFAFMQAFADTVELPIIIDDAFVAFDDVRLQQAFNLLNKIAEQTQVIYFSAKKEVYDLMDNAKITNLNEK